MVSSYTTNKAFEKPANGDYVDTWNIPVNGDFDIADKAFGGTYSVSLTNADVNLTQDNCQNVRIRCTGSLSGNIVIYFPAGISGFFIVQNSTTGTYSVTLASAGGAPGTTVLTEQGRTAFVFTDGSNVFYADDSRLSITAGTGITITGTSNLTISLTTPVVVANGGTGSGTASGARTNLSAAWTGQQIIAGAGLTGGGDLSADRTLSIPNAGVTAAMLDAGVAVANIGYTPVNKAGDTMTGALTATQVSDSAGNLRSVPQNAKTSAYVLIASDNGKHISITTGGVTVPAGVFSVGDNVTIFNNSGSSQTITQGASVTLRQANTSNTGNRTLGGYGICTILCVASNTFVITGNGVS